MHVTTTEVKQILTRTTGFLRTVASHSLQPYRGCGLGNSLCGVACYVQHNHYLTKGEKWGSFIEGRLNAAEAYRRHYERERDWARRNLASSDASGGADQGLGRFGVFLSSSTEPFQPLERTMRITRSVLEAMVERPPDFLIVQSHSHHMANYLDLYPVLASRTELRFHMSIESDQDELPGLPRPGSPIFKRLQAAGDLKAAGMRVVITVAPLLPIRDPERFFERLTEVADAVVIDHFIGGDGSVNGSRTLSTKLPMAMEAAQPGSGSRRAEQVRFEQ